MSYQQDTVEVSDRHRKQLSVSRGYLEGRGYFTAAEALETVRRLEQGTRKDGVTPKFHHQLSVARLVMTLEPHLIHKEETIAAGYLHDILEDHGDVWSRESLSAKFGPTIADAVWLLTKKYQGAVKDHDRYFDEIAKCSIASVIKLADRAHNLQTMQGVFNSTKQREYLAEVDNFFFTNIRVARRNFPKQYGAYENLKILLRCQVRLVKQVLEAEVHGMSEADKHLDAMCSALMSANHDRTTRERNALEAALEYVKTRDQGVQKVLTLQKQPFDEGDV